VGEFDISICSLIGVLHPERHLRDFDITK